MTAAGLYRWANRYRHRNEAAGQGTQYPTVRQAMRRFRVTQQQVLDVVADKHGLAMGLVAADALPGRSDTPIADRHDDAIKTWDEDDR